MHGFPFACVSIGILYKKRPVIGVIFNPFLDHLVRWPTGTFSLCLTPYIQYSALKGHGAYLNLTQKLPLYPAQQLRSLSDAMIGVEWGSGRSGGVMSKKSNSFVKLAGDGQNGILLYLA